MPELKGNKALLLAEGCKLNKQKKEIDKRIAQIKKELKIKEAGTYTNLAGDELNVAEFDNFSDIDPAKVITYMRKQRMISRLPEVFKVKLTELRKIIPEDTIEGWRYPLSSSTRWSWK